MWRIDFTNEEKAKAFDRIAEHFYESNFGQMSKADIELMMFDIYLKKLIKVNEKHNGLIDYSKCSDYIISKGLGITQQRVRNLKIKNHLVNPVEFEWQKSFSTLIQNARYDEVSKKIYINIPDPNLYLEIQNFLEENGSFIEKQLNSKLLVMRLEYFINLIIASETEDNQKAIIKKLKKQFKKDNAEEKKISGENIGKMMLSGATDITAIISNLSSLISPSNVIGIAAINVINRILL